MTALVQTAVGDAGKVLIAFGVNQDYWLNGLPMRDAFAVSSIVGVDNGTVDYWHQGLPLTSANKLAYTTTAAVDRYNNGAMPLSSNGQLCVEDAAVDRYVNGIPYTASGKIAATVQGIG